MKKATVLMMAFRVFLYSQYAAQRRGMSLNYCIIKLAPIVAVTAGVVPAITQRVRHVFGRKVLADTFAATGAAGYIVSSVKPVATSAAEASSKYHVALASS